MPTPKDGLYQVATPTLCAGLVLRGGRVAECAPILRRRLAYWITRARWICPMDLPMYEHVCEWRPLRSVTAPTGPHPEHTRFELLICAGCQRFEVFPRSNYTLTTAHWREMFVAGMAALGFRPYEGI